MRECVQKTRIVAERSAISDLPLPTVSRTPIFFFRYAYQKIFCREFQFTYIFMKQTEPNETFRNICHQNKHFFVSEHSEFFSLFWRKTKLVPPPCLRTCPQLLIFFMPSLMVNIVCPPSHKFTMIDFILWPKGWHQL